MHGDLCAIVRRAGAVQHGVPPAPARRRVPLGARQRRAALRGGRRVRRVRRVRGGRHEAEARRTGARGPEPEAAGGTRAGADAHRARAPRRLRTAHHPDGDRPRRPEVGDRAGRPAAGARAAALRSRRRHGARPADGLASSALVEARIRRPGVGRRGVLQRAVRAARRDGRLQPGRRAARSAAGHGARAVSRAAGSADERREALRRTAFQGVALGRGRPHRPSGRRCGRRLRCGRRSAKQRPRSPQHAGAPQPAPRRAVHQLGARPRHAGAGPRAVRRFSATSVVLTAALVEGHAPHRKTVRTGRTIMKFRRIGWLEAALAMTLAIGAPLTAQAQGRGAVAEPYTPARDAKDLKSVLFRWMWAEGILKGHDERDMVASLEYQGKGAIQVDGQPCTLTKFRASTNYQSYSQRISYTCTRANGQTYSNVEVVSGLYAWNEDMIGAEIGGARGKATPMPAAVQERLIRFWAGPQGAPKAAVAGTTDTFWLGANPGTLFADGVDKVRDTSLVWEGGKPVVTFPLPGVAGAIATATLDSRFLTEKVVVKSGATTTEFAYSNYQDFNNPLNKIEVLYAGRLIERRNGTLVRDLTTTETETGNVYVVAPVPASVKAA